jgi:tripartite-type tricarboxylate transporter receptor subunit TctC
MPCLAFAQNQNWPSQPIRIVVPYPAGGVTDIVARLLAKSLTESLKTSVVIENIAGANGAIGAMTVVRSAPNGYTLLMGTPATLVTNMILYPGSQYDAFKDLDPIARVVSMPNALVVRNDLGVNTVNDLIGLLKKDAGKLSYGVTGIGANGHLTTALFLYKTQTQATAIPYKGAAPLLAGLIGGQTDFTIDQLTSSVTYIKSGRIKLLAVSSALRSPYFPETPTLKESGVTDFDMGSWLALSAPKNTPNEMINRLNSAVNQALQDPAFKESLAQFAATPTGGTAAELTRLMQSESDTVKFVVQTAKISVDQ